MKKNKQLESKRAKQWNDKFEFLKKFKKRFHHCNVPDLWKENPALGRWVAMQRTHRHLLSKERIRKLNELGFTWNMREFVWERDYQKLIAFKGQFGHCEVPKGRKEFAQLAEWVGKQRIDKRKGLSRLSAERISKLNKIGFHWGRENKPWDERFKELKAFKSRFGHCRVLRSWKENPGLAKWVAHQRRGRHKLSADRKKKLNQLGFVWLIKHPVGR